MSKLCENMDWQMAYAALREEYPVQREAWTRSDGYLLRKDGTLRQFFPDGTSKAYIAGTADLQACDWFVPYNRKTPFANLIKADDTGSRTPEAEGFKATGIFFGGSKPAEAPIKVKTPEPSLAALAKHSEVILSILNNIARGSEDEAVFVVRGYGAIPAVGREFHKALKEVFGV